MVKLKLVMLPDKFIDAFRSNHFLFYLIVISVILANLNRLPLLIVKTKSNQSG